MPLLCCSRRGVQPAAAGTAGTAVTRWCRPQPPSASSPTATATATPAPAAPGASPPGSAVGDELWPFFYPMVPRSLAQATQRAGCLWALRTAYLISLPAPRSNADSGRAALAGGGMPPPVFPAPASWNEGRESLRLVRRRSILCKSSGGDQSAPQFHQGSGLPCAAQLCSVTLILETRGQCVMTTPVSKADALMPLIRGVDANRIRAVSCLADRFDMATDEHGHCVKMATCHLSGVSTCRLVSLPSVKKPPEVASGKGCWTNH